MKTTYDDFIKSKLLTVSNEGFEVNNLPNILFGHQKDIVTWAAKGGRRAIFASFGMGKSIMQLTLIQQCLNQFEGKGLIVCPLGVKQEFVNDAQKLGMELTYVKNQAECESSPNRYLITNYERIRDGDINPEYFVITCLDEASVLRGFGTKTYQTFLTKFASVRFKYVATATPAPNELKEIIHYAGYLGVMDTGQALTRFFARNPEKAGDLTIHPHKVEEFWLWVASWAVLINKPSDLGYSDAGYNLPEIKIVEHRVTVTERENKVDRLTKQATLVADSSKSLSEAAKEKRDSIQERVNKALGIIQNDTNNTAWLLWHHQENERRAIEKGLPEAKTVFGNQDLDEKESLLISFTKGEYRILATKPEIAGQGCNFQHHCHKAIFVGINYQFNDFIQAIHRIHRFGQNKPVEIHIIYTNAEDSILKALYHKWNLHREMQERMKDIMQKYKLNAIPVEGLTRKLGLQRAEIKGSMFRAVNNDCVNEVQNMPENSIDLTVTSIPFSNQYEYSASYNDFGHNDNDDRFFEQLDFLITDLLRVTKPGRIAAIHVKDRIMFAAKTGFGCPTINPFSDKTVAAFMKHGWLFIARRVVTTDVVRENNQTYRLGYTEMRKDATKMGSGMPEYVLVFRKPATDLSDGYADLPVSKQIDEYSLSRWQLDADAYWKSSGNRPLLPSEIAKMNIKAAMDTIKHRETNLPYDHERHVAIGDALKENEKLPTDYASLAMPSNDVNVWSDITRMRTLNMEQSRNGEQNHICPLQFDIVERLIRLYSNKGETVFDPFGGLMTVPYCAIKLDRKGYGVELNPTYWQAGVEYCKKAEHKAIQPTLFDFLNQTEPEILRPL